MVWSQNLVSWWLKVHNMVRRVSLYIVPNTRPVYVWTSPTEACIPENLVPAVKHGAWFLMSWAAISSILLVLYLLCMVELLPVSTWTFEVARCILWSRCCFLTMMQFSRRIAHTHSQKCSVLVWGAWRCTSTSSLASTITQLKYHWTTGQF